MYGSIFADNSNLTGTDLKPFILEQFKQIIDPDNFSHNFKVKGGSIPDDSIINLLKTMYNDSNTNIEDYTIKYFGEFVHNRVGTLLTKNEKENINLLSRPDFTTGNLMIWQKRFQEYEWVIYNYEDLVTNTYVIKRMTSDNELIDESVRYGELFYYNDKVLQKSNKNINFSDIILETYILNNS
jgi:hypothetical protein